MNAHSGNILNGIVLMAMSAWGYLATGAPTSFIAGGFGLLFLICSPWIKKDHKIVSHIVVLLTFLLIIMLFKPFSAAMADGRTLAMVRVGAMILAGIIAMITFIKSFRAARLAREAGQ